MDTAAASVHPCKHGVVMKKLVDMMSDGGSEIRVDQYLFVFLKCVRFMAFPFPLAFGM